MKRVKDYESFFVLLILAYLLFFQDKVHNGLLKSTLDILLIILMMVMIIDKSLDISRKIRERRS
ncbi:hypothetical protein CVN76_04260 [Bacillus sp. mrc49]|nr:hypothetical protein CVN76_04260 [Bacillus sp. mrc49]